MYEQNEKNKLQIKQLNRNKHNFRTMEESKHEWIGDNRRFNRNVYLPVYVSDLRLLLKPLKKRKRVYQYSALPYPTRLTIGFIL